MKTFLITILFIGVFTNCSTKNAFSYLQTTPFQEKSEENTLSSKISDGDTIDGIVSAIYLNNIKSDTDKSVEDEHFYVYLYTKSNYENFRFFLNDKEAISVKSLGDKNIFSHLSKFDAKWGQYFLATFTQTEDENLSFFVQNKQFFSNKLLFEKDMQ